MQKRTSSNAARKAWNILRFALIWARKGGVFIHKRRLVMMMHLPKFIKTLRHTDQQSGYRGALYYGDRQLSFDDTPVIHVKMHRPNSMRFHLPCITPVVDFDYDFDDEKNADQEVLNNYYNNDIVARKSFLKNGREHDDEDEIEDDVDDQHVSGQLFEEEEEGIDMKAEEFIANFYEQLKLQRQISYLQYK